MDTVLVVEDEPLIAWNVEDELTEAGYNVLVAANASQAISLLEARTDITTVFTDIDMPGTINGLEAGSMC